MLFKTLYIQIFKMAAMLQVQQQYVVLLQNLEIGLPVAGQALAESFDDMGVYLSFYQHTPQNSTQRKMFSTSLKQFFENMNFENFFAQIYT